MDNDSLIHGLLLFIPLYILAKKKLLKKTAIFMFVIGLIQWLFTRYIDCISISVMMSFFGIVYEINLEGKELM
ncbi:MAG TPA: hypothetical protein VIM70_11450 [Clostridium sp.]|uniref:hypothetical protein n=1 Tax=Clostridium sp. TaxID=1506 RepID=UPI002F933B09